MDKKSQQEKPPLYLGTIYPTGLYPSWKHAKRNGSQVIPVFNWDEVVIKPLSEREKTVQEALDEDESNG